MSQTPVAIFWMSLWSTILSTQRHCHTCQYASNQLLANNWWCESYVARSCWRRHTSHNQTCFLDTEMHVVLIRSPLLDLKSQHHIEYNTPVTAKVSPCHLIKWALRFYNSQVMQQNQIQVILDNKQQQNILAPCGTDGQLFTTDVSAKFKVMWHKN